MCNFFSLVSNGEGKIYYFDAEQRKELKEKYESLDSHTSIADYYGFKGEEEDTLNKYEYNPLTKEFTVDQINTTDDREKVKEMCLKLNFKYIVPELIIKPIFHPLKDVKRTPTVTKNDIKLLKEWINVRAYVWDSVWDSVWASVWASVRDSVRASVRDSVWASVWDSVCDSVRDSVWDSVRDSVRDSVWDSVWAYSSSFFNIKYNYDFSSLNTLWNKGLVPSFDGKVWRLHGGKDAKILYELK